MKNMKKILSGILAVTMVSGFAACNNDSSGGGGADATTTTEATTTTGVTVAVNTEGLKEGEQELLESAMDQLRDVELENKEIKWLGNYTINPDTDGRSKDVGLEMFEQKYGGYVTEVPCDWGDRYNQLSTLIVGGEGIDFFPAGDDYNFPKGIISGMFEPVDDYIDVNSPLWLNTKEGMELYNFGGHHFAFVTNVSPQYICAYNKQTIEENGLDDPWELYQEGNWNWDTFKKMLQDFVDEDNGLYGLDNWYYEKALWSSAGAVAIDKVDDHMVSMLNDATLEKAENFGYELRQNRLLLDHGEFNWQLKLEMMGEGRQLFNITGIWEYYGDPATWASKIPAENLGIVPVPSPAGSDPYSCVQVDGFVLCKGATNPEGVALFSECKIMGAFDEGAVAVGNRKAMDDNEWTEEVVEQVNTCNELALKYPVYDYAAGCSTDIASYTVNDASNGLRVPFAGGSDWATEREKIADAIDMLVKEVDAELQTKLAELG